MASSSYKLMMLDDGGLWAYTIMAGDVFVDDFKEALLEHGHTETSADEYITKWLINPAQYYLENWKPDE